MIPMSPSEVLDRYSILQLKKERLTENESRPIELEYWTFRGEAFEYLKNHPKLEPLLSGLYSVNGKIWDLEFDIRRGLEGKLGLDEVGRRALQIRDLNRQRIKYKNDIVDVMGTGYKDVKMNHGSAPK